MVLIKAQLSPSLFISILKFWDGFVISLVLMVKSFQEYQTLEALFAHSTSHSEHIIESLKEKMNFSIFETNIYPNIFGLILDICKNV